MDKNDPVQDNEVLYRSVRGESAKPQNLRACRYEQTGKITTPNRNRAEFLGATLLSHQKREMWERFDILAQRGIIGMDTTPKGRPS